MTVLFISSDARPRYVLDIPKVVATPENGRFRFRYQSRYLAPDVQGILSGDKAVGESALICFVGGKDTAEEYILPVRYARIVDVAAIGDAFVVTFAAKEFACIDSWPRRKDELLAYGKTRLEQLKADYHGEYYASVARDSSIQSSPQAVDVQAWTGVVERLLATPTFEKTYFLRTDFVDAEDRELEIFPDPQGWVHVDPRKPLIIRAWFYGNEPDFNERIVKIEGDPEVLYPSSDDEYRVNSRYDEITFWLTPKGFPGERRTLLRLTASAASPSVPDVATEVDLRFLVTRPAWPRVKLASVGGVSAAAVATPAILGPSAPLWQRIGLAAAGALGVAWTASSR